MHPNAVNSTLSQWSQAIRTRSVTVGVLGLGYAGLPLAEVFTTAGFSVLGFDVDSNRVAALQRGEGYLRHFGQPRVQALREGKLFQATTDFGRLREVQAAFVCVPTPLTPTRDPDLAAVITATRALAQHLPFEMPGSGHSLPPLIVLESTTYPGTTRTVVQPILEQRGHQCGCDFFLAYSPEREDPGRSTQEGQTASIPRVVGGVDSLSGEIARQLCAAVMVHVVPVSSAEVAEACKILENTYRAVNIALVNELKILYDRMGIDIWEVVDAASTKPFGFQPFYPGPGWGGHCIPIDPFYLAWVARKVGTPAQFVELAGEINLSMPRFVVSKISDALNDRCKPLQGSKICLLGMAYKRDVDDPRESPGLQLVALLQDKGVEVCYHDPHVPFVREERRGLELHSKPLTAELLHAQDCVVVVTDHSAFDWTWVVEHAKLVVDTRNATRSVQQHRQRIVRA